MKRLFAVLLAAALLAGGAFAEISFNAQVAAELWGSDGFRFALDMAGSNGTADDWGTTDSATLFNLGYSADKGGVAVDIRPSDGKGLYVHNYSGWFKPVDMLKISMGTNVAISAFGAETIRWNCLGARAGEVTGAAVELTPVDGLYLGYVLASAGEDIDKAKMGAAASYGLDGIGTFGVQWTTGGGGIDGKEMALGVGADLAIIDGVVLKPVYTIALDNKDNGKKPMHKIDLYFEWGTGPFSLKLLERALVRTYDLEGMDDYTSNFGNIVKAELNYAVTDSVAVNLKAAWGMNVTGITDKDMQDATKFNADDKFIGNGDGLAADTGNGDWDGISYWDKVYKANGFSVYLSVPIALDAGVTVKPGFMLKATALGGKVGDMAEAADVKWSIPLTVSYSF